jgi:glycine/D-amino acid oxidase-like deaminating enzyme
MTVGHAIWPDQLSDAERALLSPGIHTSFDREPDVLVIGGGIVGCATALACLRAGLGSVVLLERERLGAGASSGAAGILAPEFHVASDPPALVRLMQQSLADWRDLEATLPSGVGLLPYDFRGHAQARVNPLRALARLAASLPCIASGVEATGVGISGDDRIATVRTTAGEFRPRSVVFATGTPPRLDGLSLNLRASEVKGHIAVSEPTDLPSGQTIGNDARVIDDGRILVGGSLDVGDDERVLRPEIADALWAELGTFWPRARSIAVDYRWACFRPAHPDHLPVIDRLPGLSNAWFTSGHYKTGILLAPATGRALADWITTGSAPALVMPFSSARWTLVGEQ